MTKELIIERTDDPKFPLTARVGNKVIRLNTKEAARAVLQIAKETGKSTDYVLQRLHRGDEFVKRE